MELADAVNVVIILEVMAVRFLLPLLIPRYPLPVIIGAMLIDAADQTIFETFIVGSLDTQPVAAYQSYDKALDIYYLSIAYISTLLNWRSISAIQLSQFLFYFRIVGVVMFELTKIRVLLFIFPNIFEYFFIFYEAISVRWHALRLTRKHLFGAVALIWLVIKLPQEYIIHIAQVDTTDWLRTAIYDVPVETSMLDMLKSSLLITGLLSLIILLMSVILFRLGRKLPPCDHPHSFSKDTDATPDELPPMTRTERLRLLLEKFLLLTMITIIFAQILPNIGGTPMQLAVRTGLFILVNSGLSILQTFWREDRRSMLREFIELTAGNIGLVLLILVVFPSQRSSINLADYTLLSLILIAITILFDHYQKVYQTRLWLIDQQLVAETPTV